MSAYDWEDRWTTAIWVLCLTLVAFHAIGAAWGYDLREVLRVLEASL